MKIIKIEINNYRNLDGIKIYFDDDCNFIVGENNLGKSNLLSMLNTIFSFRSFRYEDFKDITKPIEIILQIKLSDIEIGHFQDLFDTNDYTLINIVCRQINADDNIEFYHLETSTYIQSKVVKCINYVYYDSLRNPISEINFDKGRGVGRFLKSIVSKYIEDNGIKDIDFLDQEKIDALLKSINGKIVKIKSFKDFDISATADDDLESLLTKIVIFKDVKGDALTKSGYGVQFLILVTLSILEKIQFIRQQRKDRGIFEDEKSGLKTISLVLGLDEPEIHLHPYMQRSLIKYLNSIISNKNEDFRELIKDLFDIDSFVGQVIVVTHSPNVILNDYKQIIRFYSENGSTKVISGKELKLDPQLEKHLYLHFPFIKEAYFSRCAIFVEGDTEYACLQHFAQKLLIDFDDLGICVIQARGDAIPQLINIAFQYGLPSVGITDKDDGSKPPTLPNHLQTNLRNFEEEIVAIINDNKEYVLRRIINIYDPKGDKRELVPDTLNKWAYRKYSVVTSEYTAGLRLADIPTGDVTGLISYYITWLSINKSYTLGRLIGETVTINEIPVPYQQIIIAAYRLVNNV